MKFLPYLVLQIFVCGTLQSSPNDSSKEAESLIQKVNSVTFLITVNDTWATAYILLRHQLLFQGRNLNLFRSVNVIMGHLNSAFNRPRMAKSLMSVHLTFHSSVIVDASPPACDIQWNGTYLVPTKMTEQLPSLLPGCIVGDSREGYHMTYYCVDCPYTRIRDSSAGVTLSVTNKGALSD